MVPHGLPSAVTALNARPYKNGVPGGRDMTPDPMWVMFRNTVNQYVPSGDQPLAVVGGCRSACSSWKTSTKAGLMRVPRVAQTFCAMRSRTGLYVVETPTVDRLSPRLRQESIKPLRSIIP